MTHNEALNKILDIQRDENLLSLSPLDMISEINKIVLEVISLPTPSPSPTLDEEPKDIDLMEYDLSSQPHEYKLELINTISKISAKMFMEVFYSCGLKLGIEQMVVNESDGEKFIMFFKKCTPDLLTALSSCSDFYRDVQQRYEPLPTSSNTGGTGDAIGFANFIDANQYKCMGTDGDWREANGTPVAKSTAELYNLYIQSKK